MIGKIAVGLGLFVSLILAVAAIGAGTHTPDPRPPKSETRNEHCQKDLMVIGLATGEQMSARDRVNWCLAQGYGWDEHKPAPQRKLDPKTKLVIMAHIAADHDWAIQHCHLKGVPLIGLDGALRELLPRWRPRV
jgi:hypothetical protein